MQVAKICLHHEEMLILCVRSYSQLHDIVHVCSAYVHGALSRLTPHSHTLHAVSVIVIYRFKLI